MLNPRDTSVQMFEWSWNDLAKECTDFLGPQGFGGIQISPPQASRVTTSWWGVYQPVNYTSLTSRFGTAAQLRAMIGACHAAGVRVYADVVVNQMAAGKSGTAGLATDGSAWDASTLTYPRFGAADFHAACDILDIDYKSTAGRANVQNCRLSNMPDLDSENSHVRGQIIDYLDSLLVLGIDGFRIDAAKHQAATSLQAILSAVKEAHAVTQLGEPPWVTQEIIPDSEAVRSDYLAVGTINEFKYTYAMRDAFRNTGSASLSTIPVRVGSWNNWGGTIGVLQPEHATVFINNWDSERDGTSMTASNDTGTYPNDTQGTHRYELANIFMLAHGYGEAQLFSGFRFKNRDHDRPAASPYANGAPQINVQWDFLHRWPAIAPMVKFRSAMHGQAIINWVAGNPNQVAFSRGRAGFVAINNTTSPWAPAQPFHTGLPAGVYCNVVHGLKNAAGIACLSDTVTVDANGDATITVPPDGGESVPAVAIYVGQKL